MKPFLPRPKHNFTNFHSRNSTSLVSYSSAEIRGEQDASGLGFVQKQTKRTQLMPHNVWTTVFLFGLALTGCLNPDQRSRGKYPEAFSEVEAGIPVVAYDYTLEDYQSFFQDSVARNPVLAKRAMNEQLVSMEQLAELSDEVEIGIPDFDELKRRTNFATLSGLWE